MLNIEFSAALNDLVISTTISYSIEYLAKKLIPISDCTCIKNAALCNPFAMAVVTAHYIQCHLPWVSYKFI